MLEFLQTGKALFVLAAIVFLGTMSKLITRSLYRRLLKDTENMAMTRNKNLTILKQKLENTYRVNQNIVNSKAYLDKLMYEFRFGKLSLEAWDNVSHQMICLGLLAGGAGSFLSYHYRIEPYYMVLYACAGALGGLFLLFLESSCQIEQKRQRLETVLLEYVDNSVFIRAARENASRDAAARDSLSRTLSGGGASLRTSSGKEERKPLDSFSGEKTETARERTSRRAKVHALKDRNSRAEELLRTVRGMKEEAETPSGCGEDRSWERGKQEGTGAPARRDAESLRESLEQIAASREKGRDAVAWRGENPPDRDWLKSLSEEEKKLLAGLMKDYLSGKE